MRLQIDGDYRTTSLARGLLKLVVDLTGGDWTIGFEGYACHTHGDILYAWGYPGAPAEATRAFVDDIIGSRRPIVVWRINGQIRDVDFPLELDLNALRDAKRKSLAKYGEPGETFEVRYWDDRLPVD